MRWTEARTVADSTVAGTGGLDQPWMRVLALLPMVSDADPPADAELRIAAALRHGTDTVPWFAALEASGSDGVGAARWRLWDAVRWRRDVRLGWVNDGDWSVRNPAGRGSLTDTEFVQLREFFAGLGVD